MEEIDGLVLVLGMEGKIVLIGRSRVPEFNVAELMGRFGGGGHPVAASATLKEEPIELLEEKIVRELRSIVRPIKIAADIMTRPVISVQWNTSMKEAETKLTRYGVNVLPVIRDDKYRGLISRENIPIASKISIFSGFRCSTWS